MGSPTKQRDRVAQLAKTSTADAARAAEDIDDPWMKAQALAWVARFAESTTVVDYAHRAHAAAMLATDAYQQVAACAWPLRALVETGNVSQAKSLLSKMLPATSQIQEPGSKAEAFTLLLHAVFPGGSGLWKAVLDRMLESIRNTHWRSERALQDAALLVHAADADAAKLFAEGLEPKLSAKVLRKLGSNISKPRPFFW